MNTRKRQIAKAREWSVLVLRTARVPEGNPRRTKRLRRKWNKQHARVSVYSGCHIINVCMDGSLVGTAQSISMTEVRR